MLSRIPTSEEYEDEVNRLGDLIRKAQNDHDTRYRVLVTKRQGSACAGIRGWRAKGYPECQAWKDDGVREWDQERPSLQNSIESSKQNLKDYQNAVIAVRDLENKRKIEEHLAEQAKLIEDRIAESFRVETEKFMAIQESNSVSNDQTLVQTVNTSTDRGFIAEEKLQSQQGLQGSFFPIMLLGVMFS